MGEEDKSAPAPHSTRAYPFRRPAAYLLVELASIGEGVGDELVVAPAAAAHRVFGGMLKAAKAVALIRVPLSRVDSA